MKNKSILNGLFGIAAVSLLIIISGCASTRGGIYNDSMRLVPDEATELWGITVDPLSDLDLAGTRWKLMYTIDDDFEDREFVIEFMEGGFFRSFTPAGSVYGYETENEWEKDGKTLSFHFTNKYSSYTGEFLTADLLRGTAENVRNLSWDFELIRIE